MSGGKSTSNLIKRSECTLVRTRSTDKNNIDEVYRGGSAAVQNKKGAKMHLGTAGSFSNFQRQAMTSKPGSRLNTN